MEAGKHNEKTICDISDLLETFGKYQIIQYLLVFLPEVFISMMTINYVFAVGDVNYRCRIGECEDANSTVQFPTWWPDTNIDRCSAPVLRDGEEVCTNDSFTGVLATCNHWIYESNNTIVAELDLACQPWKSNVVGTIHCIGMLLSMIVCGWISDRYGRKPTLIFCAVAGSIGNMKALATSYYIYVIIEFLEAAVTGGFFASATVLLIEIVGNKYRLLSGITCSYAIYLGEFLLGCAAMFAPYWKTLIYISYGPCIFFIFLIFFIHESPRWQIVSGRIDKSKVILKKIADGNKISINNEELTNIDEQTIKQKFNIKSEEVKENLMDAFKSKEILKRLLVAGMCRFTSGFVYNGMLINSVWLPGDKYINFLLTSVMSFPGELLCLYLMNKIGRKIPLQVGFSTCGVLCIISVFIPARYLWAKLTIFLIAKFITSTFFTGAITYSMELFPTSARGSLIGCTSFFCRMGSMLAPLTPILNTVSEALPFIIMGFSSILTGLLLCLTPETKNLPLLDTIAQIENYGMEKIQPETQKQTQQHQQQQQKQQSTSM